MKIKQVIAVVGTFDSKGEEHVFLEERIKKKGFGTLTIHVGTGGPSPVRVNLDLFEAIRKARSFLPRNRDRAIAIMVREAQSRIKQLYQKGQLNGIISAGGGTGTYLCTQIMQELPFGVPKVMVSTVASRNMAEVVGTKDITMIHSVADLLGINSISGKILDMGAACICGMIQSRWQAGTAKKRIALSFFGFITPAAEAVKKALENSGYEVIGFHANGTGGMALEEIADSGYFDGILDLATHELADHLKGGYCGGIGVKRFTPPANHTIPRLIIPGGLDCAVLEFTRETIPEKYKKRKIFFYDFRSAIRLTRAESQILADQLAERLNKDPQNIKVLIPQKGWSVADRQGGPLYDPPVSLSFLTRFRKRLDPQISLIEVGHHINDKAFALKASAVMDDMIRNKKK
jgi:uncharacterized protein (UPF0261 family)